MKIRKQMLETNGWRVSPYSRARYWLLYLFDFVLRGANVFRTKTKTMIVMARLRLLTRAL